MIKLNGLTQGFVASKTLVAFVMLIVVIVVGGVLVNHAGKKSTQNDLSPTAITQVNKAGAVANTASPKSTATSSASSTSNNSSATTTSTASSSEVKAGTSKSSPIVVGGTINDTTPGSAQDSSSQTPQPTGPITGITAYLPALTDAGSYASSSSSIAGKCIFNEEFPFYVNGSGIVNVPNYLTTSQSGMGPITNTPGTFVSFSQATQYSLKGNQVSFSTSYNDHVVVSVHFTVVYNNVVIATSPTAQFACP